jgi:choline dehydrogenase-like flavoprotein
MTSIKNAVIGSGPGGAITAALLAEAGHEVSLYEEGSLYPLDSCEAFSQNEMKQKYRNSGITVAMGKPKIAYVEGNCVGGGSEVNAGLYHRTPNTLIEQWSRDFGLRDYTPSSLSPYFEISEQDMNVCLMPDGTQPAASLKLHEGASKLGWHSMEVPRWFKYEPNGNGVKQSMTETFIPRAIKAGSQLHSSIKIMGLSHTGRDWMLSGFHQTGNKKLPFSITAENVFLCGGTIGSATLLQRNKLSPLAGKTLHMHPSIKLVARFKEEINSASMGVPVHQVKEFSPRYSFGCSISSLPYLKMAMIDIDQGQTIVENHWQHMAIYYSMVTSGIGRIHTLPFYKDPVVTYNLGQEGIKYTLEGLLRLGECLFAAGAIEVYPVVYGSEPIRSLKQLQQFVYELSVEQLNLMTIHLFSSCPMGERLDRCVTDSYGKVHGQKNLYVNDASLLCTAPGVNPQGSVMALVRRNINHFLSESQVNGK